MYSLIIVGTLYLLSGLWCAWQPDLASNYLGFGLSGDLARSEFFSVYGGLQCGLAVAMISSSMRPAYRPAALFFALVFSLVLMVFRALSMVMVGPLIEVVQMLILELVIVLILASAWLRSRPQSSGFPTGAQPSAK